jgi:hypothetical protein
MTKTAEELSADGDKLVADFRASFDIVYKTFMSQIECFAKDVTDSNLSETLKLAILQSTLKGVEQIYKDYAQ